MHAMVAGVEKVKPSCFQVILFLNIQYSIILIKALAYEKSKGAESLASYPVNDIKLKI